jgi:cytochrome c-type biogenesis protein CcmH
MTVRVNGLLRALATIVVVVASVTPAASGQTAAPTPNAATGDSILEARTRAVAAQLRCPVCQGLSLQDSPSELSQQMRQVIERQLASGKTEEDVKNYFVARYGEWILMSPSARGFNWLVYVLPMLALSAGVSLLALAVRRWTSGAAHADESVRARTAV